jgi:hypothetical protein
MGVEPTRDRAERPLSRFEDGETHRGPYTSILISCMAYCAIHSLPCQASACTWARPTSLSVFTINSALRKPGKSRSPATEIQRIPAA